MVIFKEKKNIYMISSDFYPKIGGVSDVLKNIHISTKKFNDIQLYSINPFVGIEISSELRKWLLVDETQIKLKKLIFKERFYKYFFLLVKSVFRKKGISFIEKIKIIVYIFKPSLFSRIINNIIQLYPILKNEDIDLLFSGNGHWNFTLTFLLSVMLKKKIVVLVHGNDYLIIGNNIFKRFFNSFKSIYYKYSDKIITTTPFGRNMVKEIHNIDRKKIDIGYIGIDPKTLDCYKEKEEIYDKFNLSKHDYIFFSVARHDKRKGYEYILGALQLFKMWETRNFVFVIGGDGEETENLKKLTEEYGLKQNVKFVGRISDKERNELYKISDLFILAPYCTRESLEGFGIVYIEAGHFKVPSIATKTGGVPYAVRDGKTGVLVKPKYEFGIYKNINRLCRNGFEREELGKNAYKYSKKLHWDKLIKKYIKIFEEVIR